MPNSPEAEHLYRAVEAIAKALLPEKPKPLLDVKRETDEERDEAEDKAEK